MSIVDTTFSISFVLDRLREADTRFRDCTLDNLINFSSKEITCGDAFFSRIVRVKFMWNKSKKIPQSIVLKIPGVQEVCNNEGEKYLIFAHRNEADTYNLLMNIQKKLNIRLKVPKTYYAADFSPDHNDGLLIMDDLTPFGTTIPMIPGFNNEQVESVIDELARITAAAWLVPDELDKLGDRPNPQEFIDEMWNYCMQLKDIDSRFDNFFEKLKNVFTKKSYEYTLHDDNKFGFPPTIVHTDLWAPNIIFEQYNGVVGNNLVSIIDWQGAARGNPCGDILRVLAVNTTSKYRRDNTERLLRRYMIGVQEAMGGKAPFTFDQLQYAFAASSAFVAMFMGFGVPMYYHMPAVVGTDPIKREILREELLDRAECMFEDTLALFDKYNLY